MTNGLMKQFAVRCGDAVAGRRPIRTCVFTTAWGLSMVLSGSALANGVPEIQQDGLEAGASVAATMSEDGAPTAFAITPPLTAIDTSGDTNLIEWSVSTPATNGVATVSGTGGSPTTFTYVPKDNFNGMDSFVVQVEDSDSNTDTIVVNVTVDPVNDAPTFTDGYEFTGKWGSSGMGDGQFTSSGAVAITTTGKIVVCDYAAHRVQIFEPDGTFISKFGSLGGGDGQFLNPSDVAIDSSGNLYVTEFNGNRVQKFDSSGNFLLKWGSLGTASGQFDHPQAIAVGPSDEIYVADTRNNRVQKFDSSGNFVLQWGAMGAGDGEFNSPRGIEVDSMGNVYVSEWSNRRIQKFDSNGNFLLKWGSSGSGDGQFILPGGIAVGPNDTIFAVDANLNRVQEFSSSGSFLGKWGSLGTDDGQFQGVSFSPGVNDDGRVYVGDTNSNRVQYFDKGLAGPSKTVMMDEDGVPVAFGLTLEASDVDMDTLTWSISSAASEGTATVSGTGFSKSIGYTPNANFNGSDSFTVQVDDGNSGVDTIVVNVTVSSQNDAPVITEGAGPLTVTMDEDGSPTAFVAPTLGATDLEMDTLTWSVSSAATNGTATVSGSGASPGTFTYVPADNFNGSDSFTVQVSDGNGGTDTIVVNVTVNSQPELVDVTTNTGATVSEGGTVILLSSMLNSSDGESAPGDVNYTVTDGPSDGMLVLVSDTETAITAFTQDDINNTRVVFVHDGAENATAGFDFSVTNGETTPTTGSFEFTVTPVDDVPTLSTSSDASLYTEDGDAIVVDPALTVVDPDGGDPIEGARVAISSAFVAFEDVLAVTEMHGITGSFSASQGVLTLSGSATAAQYQEVLRSVVFSSSGSPDDTRREITFSLGDAIAYSENGHFYRFETARGISWDDAKTAASALRYFGLEGYLTTVTSEGENNFVVDKLSGQGWMGATDVGAEGVWRWVTGPEGLEDGGMGLHFYTGTGNGSAVGGAYNNWANVEPNDFGSGEDYAHFLASGEWNDFPLQLSSITGYVVEFGSLPEGIELHLVDTKAVDIMRVNDAPVIAQGDAVAVTMDEDGTPTAFAAPTLSASDEEDDPITWTLASGATHGTATVSGMGATPTTLTYTPNAQFNGMDSFVIAVSDDSDASNSITVNVTVNAQNDLPTIDQGDSALSVTMDEDNSPMAFVAPMVGATDIDGDTLTWSVSSAPENGVATVSGSGAMPGVFTYTPATNFNGVDNFTVQVDDGNGGTDTIGVNVTVNAQNDGPVIAQGDMLSVAMDEDSEPTAFVAPALSAMDVDGDTLTWSLVTEPEHGTATVSGDGASPGVFTYVPATNFNGTDSFVIEASDGNNGVDTVTVNVTVASINDMPVLAAIGSQEVDEGATLRFTVTASDVDGDTLAFDAADLPEGATFDEETATFTWTPGFDQAGVFMDVLFRVTDDGTPPLTDTETISIAVGNVNRPPVLDALENQEVAENMALTFTVTGSDPDGDAIAFSASNLPAGAEFDTETATFSWMPGFEDAGVYPDVVFTVTDNGSPVEMDSQAITVTVGDVNRMPELAAIGSREVNEGESLSFMVTATDADGDALVYSATDLPEGAEFDADTQTFAWTPDFDAMGSYDVTFTVVDDGEPSQSDSETVTIAVGDVNRAPMLESIADQAVDEGDLLSFVLAGTDADGDALSYSAADLPEGATFDAETATFMWTPGTAASGTYTVIFTVTDDGDPVLSGEATITITVNDVPELEGDLASELLAVFDDADTNGDGLISREESTALFEGLTVQQFDSIDTNNDGFLSEPELRGANPVGGCLSPDSGSDFFAYGLILYLLAWADTFQRRLARLMGWTAAEDTETEV